MVKLTGKSCGVLSQLFSHWGDTTVLSCLQGYQGQAWTDSETAPRCARITVGDFCFFAGDPFLPESEELIARMPEGDWPQWYLIGTSDAWNQQIEAVWKNRVQAFERYAIRKEKDVFNEEKLRRFASELPDGYELRAFDEELCRQAMAQEWSRDACGQFLSVEDYLRRGMGFGAVWGGQLVAEASTYSIYDEGFDMTIATREDHRRKGLARACAARMILEALEKGLYPAWDAKTMISVQLSEQLGYHMERPYRAYCLPVREHK